jgi:hypothetical protein
MSIQISISNAIKGSVGNSLPKLLLDAYPNAEVAYSLRRLSNSYAGNSIRVRRSSDNTEQNIGFVNNILDTASLLTFCGAGNGFVTTWYDQSGNANNATQSTAANQPQIVSSGAMITTNGKNSMSFDGSNDSFNLTSSITAGSSNYQSFVGKRDSPARKLYALGGGVSSVGYLYTLYSDNYYYLQADTSKYQASTSSDSTINQLLLTGLNNASTMSMYKNGNVISSSAGSLTYTPNILYIGFYSNSGLMAYCNLQEIIFYNSNQFANRIGIESNINTFYNIY